MKLSAPWLLFAGILLILTGGLLAFYACVLYFFFTWDGPGAGPLPLLAGLASLVTLTSGALLCRVGCRKKAGAA